MKFLSVELAGYTRISLSGVNYIKLTPTEDLQLILGTNGSGKSSLLNEITPLPSNPSNYLKEGFSVKTISHNGSIYVLKSTFNPTQKHSFIKDDMPDMNPGGTVTVQKELVKQEFGITPEIHELIMGRERFTRMSPSQRRYWFTQLSSVNYDYALSVYARLKERLRDTSGALKLNKARLVSEISKLIPKEEQETLKVEVAELHEFLSKTSEIRIPIDTPMEKINEQIIKTNNSAITFSKELIRKINILRRNSKYGNLQAVTELLNTYQSQETVLRLLLNELHDQMKKVMDNLDILKQTGNQGVEEITSRVGMLKQEQLNTQLNKTLLNDGIHSSPLEAIRAFEIIESTLVGIFNEIPSNGDLRYSTGAKNQATNSIEQTDEKIAYFKSEIIRLDGRKKHLEDHKNKTNLVCPKCNTPFNFGVDLEDLVKVISLIDSYSDQITVLQKNKEKTLETLNEINIYSNYYLRYKTIKDSYPVLSTLWENVDKDILNKPTQCTVYLDKFKADVILDKRYLELEDEIQNLQKLLVAKKQLGDQDLEKIKSQSESLDLSIFNKQTELLFCQNEIKSIVSYRKDLETANVLETQLTSLNKDLHDLVDNKIETLRRQCVIDGIKFIQSILSKKETMLFDLKNQESIIKNLEENILGLEDDEKCLKLIVNELSPTDGLIAEGLFGFIKLFVGQMNSFIKKIWTYDMEIMSCELSDDSKVELDYKFPIKVEDKLKPVPDVSNGSTGMMEIIDLAFKIVATKHLGLNDSPLFLDEFGTTLDHAHRTMIYGIFDYIINQIQFSQVFLVNHYSDLYGSLKNAEICILHDSNIEIPKGAVYNKHVIIA